MLQNVKQMFHQLGEHRTFEDNISVEALGELRGYQFSTPVEIAGTIENRAGIVTLSFTTDFTLDLTCDRCLLVFPQTFHYEFTHILVQERYTDENDDYIVIDGDCLDVREVAVTDLLLQLPTKILCKEDCLGLCRQCGCDLNESTCSCPSE